MLAVVLQVALTQVPGVTLDEALQRAGTGHPLVKAAKTRVAALEAEEKVASAAWLPRVGVMAQAVVSTSNNSTTTFIGSPAVDLPRIGATPLSPTADWAPAASTLVAVGVRQQVYDFGRTTAELEAARASTGVEQARVGQSTVEVRVGVIQAWYAVKAAREVLASSERSFERVRALRDFVKANVDAKLRAPVELTRAEVELQRSDVARVRAEAQLAIAQRQLAAAVGLEGALDAAGDGRLPSGSPALEALLDAASRDGRLQEAEARTRAASAQAEAVAAAWRPSLGATAALSGRAGGATPNAGEVPVGAGWLPVIPNWDVGVLLSWQALDPVAFARTDAARARAQAASAELELVRQQELAVASSAWLEAQVATRALPMLQVALQGAVANQQQAEARFRLGLATQLELTEAERLRTEAESQLALGELSVARALAGLERFTSAERR